MEIQSSLTLLGLQLLFTVIAFLLQSTFKPMNITTASSLQLCQEHLFPLAIDRDHNDALMG